MRRSVLAIAFGLAGATVVGIFAGCATGGGRTTEGGTPTGGGGSTTRGASIPGAAASGSTASAPTRTLAADKPLATTAGNTFVGPAGWTVTVRGTATILEAPEPGSRIALVDVPRSSAASAEDAVSQAWAAYRPDASWPLRLATPAPDQDGWTDRRSFSYQTSPNERRGVSALAARAGETWTVAIYDMEDAVGEKRGAQVALIFDDLLPKGHTRESFAGKKAHALDAVRLAALSSFVESARKQLRIPGVGVGIVQGGRVVFAEGFGEREIGTGVKPDADTLFMIASNTKALTTLMLARLVDEKKIAWDEPVTTILPAFRLGDADTTRQVLVKHLICACTGLPRQDMEWIFQFDGLTPKDAMGVLATMKPTSRFGELFQYSNMMAGAAGFAGGHVVDPGGELGAAYDRAMQQLVFDPLGMAATTFDFARALAGPNRSWAHAPDVDGRPARAPMELNYSVIPLRPAGAAWSSVDDMLKYIAMELREGTLPDGTRYIGRDALLARRTPQVPIGRNATYGMGLTVDTTWGAKVVHHGGDMLGFHSDMMWLPEHDVGAVVLTNGDPGWVLRDQFQRRLLEVLFDGRAEADAQVRASARRFFDSMEADRRLMTIPADPAEAGELAALYTNEALGTVRVERSGGRTTFDFGEWKSEVATRRNPDGSLSFLTIAPGIIGFEFVVGGAQAGTSGTRTLTLRDAQHEYVFREK